MDYLFRDKVSDFIGRELQRSGRESATHVDGFDLLTLLRKTNPYLACIKYKNSCSAIVDSLFDVGASDVERLIFDDFLKRLAVFISEQKCNGRKSSITGIDIELEREGIRYLIAVKSGKAWGNATQHKKLRDNFQTAVKVLKQNSVVGAIQPTLGICYGRFKTVNNGAFLHIGGQSFWELLSYEPDLYMDLIEPIGYRAKQFNEEFADNRTHALNRMVREFTERFCREDGSIDWPKIVTLVSKNA
jgi:hypothetical protein